jgi:hypothetical protein
VESNGGAQICCPLAPKLHYNAGLSGECGMIDPASVNLGYFGLLLLLVFLACVIGNFIGAYRRILGAVIATVLFGVGFIAWNYYPHGLKLPMSPTRPLTAAAPQPTPAATPAAPAAPATPVRPSNPVRDITPRQ